MFVTKSLVGLGLAGVAVTGVVLIPSKKDQVTEVDEKTKYDLQRIHDSNNKIVEECGNYKSEWMKVVIRDVLDTTPKVEERNDKNKTKEEYEECTKKHRIDPTKK